MTRYLSPIFAKTDLRSHNVAAIQSFEPVPRCRTRSIFLGLSARILSFFALAILTDAQASEHRTFIHAPNGDFNQAHEDTIMTYQTWDGSQWTAMITGNTFVHAPGADFSQAHQSDRIDYLSHGSVPYRATIDGDVFTHAPLSDLLQTHEDTIINYISWDFSQWTARLKPEPLPGYAEGYVDGYEDGLASQFQTIAELQAQLAALLGQNGQLTDQVNVLSSERNALLIANQELQQTLDSANDANSLLAEENSSLIAQNMALSGQIETLVAQNGELLEANDGLLAAANAVDEQSEALSGSFQSQFGDPSFQVPGDTMEAQVENLVVAIGNLNQGQQQALYKNLGGKKNSSGKKK